MTRTTPTTSPTPAAPDEPFCANCGYRLTGLTESSKCPECGRPIVEVLTRPGLAQTPQFGKRYRSKATLFGWPVIDIAIGPKNGEPRGHAKGVIAIGDIATGGIAVGGIARGIVAVGGITLGVFSFGGLSIGLLSATGGLALGLGLSAGGLAFGALASGGLAVGLYAAGGAAFGLHTLSGARATPADLQLFKPLCWFFGPWPPRGAAIYLPSLIIAAATSTRTSKMTAASEAFIPRLHRFSFRGAAGCDCC